MPQLMTMARTRSLKLALLVLVLFAATETAIRIRASLRYGGAFSDQGLYTTDPDIGKILRPGARAKGSEISLSINSLGFRGGEFQVEKPSGVFRIVCLGDSVVFGADAQNDQTVWTAQLQEILTSKLNRPIEVINAGVPGYSATTALKFFEKKILPLDPDMLFVCLVVNDLNIRSRQVFLPKSDTMRSTGLSAERELLRLRDTHLLSYQMIRKNLTPLVTPIGREISRHDALPEDFGDPYNRTLQQLVKEATDNNVRVVLSTQWKSFTPDQPEAVQRRGYNGLLLTNPFLSAEGFYEAFRRYNDVVRSIADTSPAILLDLAREIPPKAEYYSDGAVHLSQKGQDLLADLLAGHLMDLIPGKAE